MASIRTLPSGKVNVRWRNHNGKWQGRTFGPDEKRKAKAFKAEVETELNAGYDVDLKARRMTFQQWGELWKQGQLVNRPRTVRAVETDLKRLNESFGHRPLRAITVSEVKSWVASMKAEGLEPSTIHAKYRRMAQVMGAAVEEDLVRKSPCTSSNAPSTGRREQKIPSTEEV